MTAPFAALRAVVARLPLLQMVAIEQGGHRVHVDGGTGTRILIDRYERFENAVELADDLLALVQIAPALLRVVDRAAAVVEAIDYTTGIDADDWAHIRVEARALRAALEEAWG